VDLATFKKTIQLYLDGELPESDRRAVEAFVAGSPEAQRQLDYERRLRAMLVARLAQPEPAERKTLVLARFAAAAHQPVPAAAGGRRSWFEDVRRDRWFGWKLGGLAAAAALLLAVFLPRGSEISPARPRPPAVQHAHSILLNNVWNDYAAYNRDLGIGAGELLPHCRKKIADIVECDPKGRCWASDVDTCESMRLGEIERAVAEDFGHPVALAGFNHKFEILGYRPRSISDGERVLRVPHLTLRFRNGEISAFLFEKAKESAVFSTLLPPSCSKGERMRLHECPACRVVAMRHGDQVLVLLTCMSHTLMKSAALEIEP
jgi:hypothetical protein